MLVIVSDLHLSDGSRGESLAPGAAELFARRLRELAVSASWRADGSYRPVDRVDLVLLGDTLDVLRSVRWALRPDVRPWGNPTSPEFIDQITRITSDILANNEGFLAVVRELSEEGGLTVPPELRSARPAAAQSQPVPLRIFYMVGDCDWFYHLSAPGYGAVRQQMIRQMGLANRPDQCFPHDMTECDELLNTMRRHKVAARHGDQHDPLSFEGDRDAASLSDALVVDLVNRFTAEVESELIEDLPPAAVAGLREIDDVRPLPLIPVWLEGILERSGTLPATGRRLKTVWDRLVDEFLTTDFVRRRDGSGPAGLIDRLQEALKFSKHASGSWAASTIEWLNGLGGTSVDSYRQHALTEPDFRNRRAKHIVYGHTHLAESVPLDASFADGYVLGQMYFNAGTWRRVHRQTLLGPGGCEFIAADMMSFLVFYQGDERSGRPYETWSGSLGLNPSEVPVHRIDAGRATHARRQPVSTPNLHEHAPHFTNAPGKPRVFSARRET